MPVSTEKNFDKKFSLFKEWLSSQKEFESKSLVIEPHESYIELKKLVLRLKPSGYQVFPDYNLKLQADIMRVLNNKGFPTPNILLYESDEDIIGSEFYLMDFIDGEAPSDNPPYHMDLEGMVGKATKENRRKIWTEWLYYLNKLLLKE